MIKKMITFWMALETDFNQFWLQLGGVQGGPSGVRRGTFWLLFGSWAPLGPPTPPGPLQEASWDRFWPPF